MKLSSQIVITLFLMSAAIFLATRLLGNPEIVYIPHDAGEEERQAFIKKHHLDQPLSVQYFIYVNELLRGDFGTSFASKRPVTEMLLNALPNTILLAAPTLALAVLLAILCGTVAVWFHGSVIDRILLKFFYIGQGLPVFLVMILSVELFSNKLGWLPPAGMDDGLKSFIQPVGIMGIILSTVLSPILRNSMLENLNTDYARFLRLKGLPESRIILRHILKNSMSATLSMIVVMCGSLITGTLIVESIYAWPGIGRLTYISVLRRDYPTIQGIAMLLTLLVIGINAVVDILQTVINPALRRARG
jgi:ABC-type dipeptide/oligopeptide/nickel transport system permease component